MKRRDADAKTLLMDSLYFIGGGLLYALAIYTFASGAEFSPGGISGLALIVNYISGFPIGVVTLVLNIPLVLLSFRFIGIPFLLKTAYTMVINTIFVDLVFPRFPVYRGNPLLAAMFTGFTLGAGLALVYMRGSSSGGSDFLILSVKKVHPHFSVGQIALIFDGVIIFLGGFVFGNIDAVLYGIISSFACNVTIDYMLGGVSRRKMALVITCKGQEIADAIGAQVGRGSTLVKATGTYTGQARDMLYCVCSKSEIYKVRTIALMLDPGSMLMIQDTGEVFGEGFEASKLPGHEMPPPGAGS